MFKFFTFKRCIRFRVHCWTMLVVATFVLVDGLAAQENGAGFYEINLVYDDNQAAEFETKIRAIKDGQAKLSGLTIVVNGKRSTENSGDEPRVEIIAPREFRYTELMDVVFLVQKQKLGAIGIKAVPGLRWEVFERERFEKIHSKNPAVLALMADLCPGCKALRNKLWQSKKILNELAKRDVTLLIGNGSLDDQLAKFAKEKFDQKLPVMIINCPSMGEAPEILQKIPSEEKALKAIDDKLPVITRPNKRKKVSGTFSGNGS